MLLEGVKTSKNFFLNFVVATFNPAEMFDCEKTSVSAPFLQNQFFNLFFNPFF